MNGSFVGCGNDITKSVVGVCDRMTSAAAAVSLKVKGLVDRVDTGFSAIVNFLGYVLLIHFDIPPTSLRF